MVNHTASLVAYLLQNIASMTKTHDTSMALHRLGSCFSLSACCFFIPEDHFSSPSLPSSANTMPDKTRQLLH